MTVATITGPSVSPASGKPAVQLVVLLHGYGADGNDLIGLARPLQQILPDAAFVAPNAPDRCVVNPMGYQWFPIPWMDGSPQRAMLDGFLRAERVLNAYLDQQLAAHGLDERSLILIGFSQGTMMSLQVGLRRRIAPLGIVGFSGRLAGDGDTLNDITVRPPVLLVHGDQDELIPVDEMHDARTRLAAANVPVEWHVSQGLGHGIAPDGLQTAARFLHALTADPAP